MEWKIWHASSFTSILPGIGYIEVYLCHENMSPPHSNSRCCTLHMAKTHILSLLVFLRDNFPLHPVATPFCILLYQIRPLRFASASPKIDCMFIRQRFDTSWLLLLWIYFKSSWLWHFTKKDKWMDRNWMYKNLYFCC